MENFNRKNFANELENARNLGPEGRELASDLLEKVQQTNEYKEAREKHIRESVSYRSDPKAQAEQTRNKINKLKREIADEQLLTRAKEFIENGEWDESTYRSVRVYGNKEVGEALEKMRLEAAEKDIQTIKEWSKNPDKEYKINLSREMFLGAYRTQDLSKEDWNIIENFFNDQEKKRRDGPASKIAGVKEEEIELKTEEQTQKKPAKKSKWKLPWNK